MQNKRLASTFNFGYLWEDYQPIALVDKHYTVRPIDMLRETLQEYEDWIFEQ